MNKEQVIKHRPVIKWFCDNVDKGVWVRLIGGKNWTLTSNPTFEVFEIVIQNDKYFEFRLAQADGKTIQCSTKWKEIWDGESAKLISCEPYDINLKDIDINIIKLKMLQIKDK